MYSILLIFIVGVVLSLTLTPVVKSLGIRVGAIDQPSARKVHTTPIPRIGGLAIVLSFFLALLVASFLNFPIHEDLCSDSRRIFALFGGLVIFGLGLCDDFHPLNPRIKFLGQILAASIAYYGGLRIGGFILGPIVLNFGMLSYFITLFWFLLLINAINLIDGLDGLAAGVSFFACIVISIMSAMYPDYLISLEFAALAGVLLGFLRYNFNPASIFMGDSGSYFIGYTIAALSILGSIKSQLGAALLIPLLALGVPVFDTILSPIRRWTLGRKLFQPDKEHLHHHLLDKGISSKRVVLIIYGLSFLLCIAAIILLHFRNATAGIFLLLLIIVFFVLFRKSGYLEYLALDKFYGWFRDVSDEAGLTRGRRSFLDTQLEIERAQGIEVAWENICHALEIMKFDRGDLYLYDKADKNLPENNNLSSVRVWTRHGEQKDDKDENTKLFRIEIPLINGDACLGKFVMLKDVAQNPIEPYTMRRVEYLRRSIMTAIKKF